MNVSMLIMYGDESDDLVIYEEGGEKCRTILHSTKGRRFLTKVKLYNTKHLYCNNYIQENRARRSAKQASNEAFL